MLKTLQVSEFSQHINNAIARYKYLNREGLSDAESFAELDKVLEQGQKKMHQQMNPSDPNYLRFYYDYLYGLDFRGRSKAVIESFTQLNIPLENYRHMYVMQLRIVIWRSKKTETGRVCL